MKTAQQFATIYRSVLVFTSIYLRIKKRIYGSNRHDKHSSFCCIHTKLHAIRFLRVNRECNLTLQTQTPKDLQPVFGDFIASCSSNTKRTGIKVIYSPMGVLQWYIKECHGKID
jgi:hypothetical protein